MEIKKLLSWQLSLVLIFCSTRVDSSLNISETGPQKGRSFFGILTSASLRRCFFRHQSTDMQRPNGPSFDDANRQQDQGDRNDSNGFNSDWKSKNQPQFEGFPVWTFPEA